MQIPANSRKIIEPVLVSIKIFPNLAISDLFGSCHSSPLPFANSNENAIQKEILIGSNSDSQFFKKQL